MPINRNKMEIPFAKPHIGREEVNAVANAVKSGWITMGPKVLEFEESFAKFIGAPHCVAVFSCTDALFLSLMSLKKKPKTVSLPSLTFTATAAVCIHAGIDIDFVDIDPKTFLMKRVAKPSIPVHYAGLFCEQPNVVVEDSAHRIVPNSFTGNTTCFSFYAIKNMTTGEGGMIAVKDKDRADWFRKARLHGLSKDAWKRYGKVATPEYSVDFPGWKANMTDMQAALGVVQLKKLPAMNAKRKLLVTKYRENLGGIDRDANHLFPYMVNNRGEFFEYMKSNGVSCSLHFVPLHLQPAYKKYTKKLPITEFVCSHIVTLPLFVDMTINQVNYVSKLVEQWEKKYGKVSNY